MLLMVANVLKQRSEPLPQESGSLLVTRLLPQMQSQYWPAISAYRMWGHFQVLRNLSPEDIDVKEGDLWDQSGHTPPLD
jgi:hypothetical protein